MRVEFKNRQGLHLAARLDLPVDGKVAACAVFAHCFTCSKDLRAVGHLSRALTRNGIAVLRFDFTGLGESEGAFADTDFTSNVEDVVDAARFLEERYEAPGLLIGHSLGGSAVLLASRDLPAVRAVATIGAPFDPEHVAHLFESSREEIARDGAATVRIAGRAFRIRKSFLDDLASQDAEERIANLQRALLIMHSPSDSVVGIDNAARIYRAARHPKSFVSLDDADHLLTVESDAEYAGSVLAAWAARYLDLGVPTDADLDAHDHRAVLRIGRDRYRTDIRAGGHALVSDEPEHLGGSDAGPTPYDLLIGGLGACTAITIRMYADRKEWPLESVEVRLTHRKMPPEQVAGDCTPGDAGKRKVDVIDMEVTLAGPLDEAQRARLMEIADRCPVHRTLSAGPCIRTVERRPEAESE